MSLSFGKINSTYCLIHKNGVIFLDGSGYTSTQLENYAMKVDIIDNTVEIAKAIVNHNRTLDHLQVICQTYLNNKQVEYKTLTELLFNNDGSPIYGKKLYQKDTKQNMYYTFSPGGLSKWIIDSEDSLTNYYLDQYSIIKMVSSTDKVWYTE